MEAGNCRLGMHEVNQEIRQWIEQSVMPRYEAFDRAHRQDHARYVLCEALRLAQHYSVDADMVAVAAACHDLGLAAGRETHQLESGRIIRSMTELRLWFTPEQIETIAQAAEDHRATAKSAPRSIYGRIVAEADRQIIPDVVIRRTIQYGIRNFPEMGAEQQWKRTMEHLGEKYGEGGYLKLWIPESANAERLAQLRATLADLDAMRRIFDAIYSEETADNSYGF